MKISNYNQLLAVSTLLSGMIIFATLWNQYQKVEELSRAHFESILMVQTVDHMFTMTQIWLTTQDLLFSGQQTYLINGLDEQSDQLIQTLSAIEMKANDSNTGHLAYQLIMAIKQNDVIMNSFSQLSINDMKTWQSSIAESDKITTHYVATLEQLSSQVSKDHSYLSKQLTIATNRLTVLTWVVVSLYLLLVLLIVSWFSKYIVKPIENITTLAQQSQNTKQYIEFRQVNAPQEVITLSSAIQNFTQRITIEKQKAEQERLNVTKVNEKINTIMDTIPCSLLLLDDKGIIEECNTETGKLLSSSKENIVGRNVAIFLPALATLDGQFDQEMALKSNVESLLAPNLANPYIEFSGRSIAVDKNTNYLITISDINERKHNQGALSALTEQLVNAEKLASIGRLSAGIAHEINNPVGYIRSNIDVLDGYLQPLLTYIKLVNCDDTNAAAQEFYEQEDLDFVIKDIDPLVASTLEGTIRIAKIIKDLGNYAHVDNEEPEPIFIDDIIEKSLTLATNELKYKVTIIKCLNANVEVMGFPQKLLQVFINILVNAAHAIEKQGEVLINSSIEQHQVKISFEDNGAGIAEEHLKNIFDPFFTTKPVGKGTGLGLHIVRSIIENHHGRINVRSLKDKGSTFDIFLPIRNTNT